MDLRALTFSLSLSFDSKVRLIFLIEVEKPQRREAAFAVAFETTRLISTWKSVPRACLSILFLFLSALIRRIEIASLTLQLPRVNAFCNMSFHFEIVFLL